MPSDFVHLHVHSEYSLLDGAIKIESLVNHAARMGMRALALTDHGNMFGTVKFYKMARKAGIKPIIGMEAYITRGSRLETSRKRGELSQLDHLVLLAANEEGYRNLMHLSSIGYLEGFYYKPRIDLEVLERHRDGLIAMSSCIRGIVAQAALGSGREEATRKALKMDEIFGRGNFYLELQDHGLPEEQKVLETLVEVSRSTGIPLVATNDAHYLRKEDAEAHEVLLCLQTQSDIEDPGRFRFKSDQLYLKPAEEMVELFSDFPQAVENALQIAERCDVKLEQDAFFLPRVPLPEGYRSNSEYLRHCAYEGAGLRFGEISEEVKERLDYELSVIDAMNFPGYFLVVKDIIDFAKERGIPVGPGRGSAAGSLVCYCLGITDVNPLEHDLLFERLLNPERVSMPDIDIDFCYERRDEVIRYVIDRYSKENVCQIITFGTMAARGVVRDVGRVLKIPYAEVDRVAKLIPAHPGTSLEEAISAVPELRSLVRSNGLYEKWFKLSLTLEGLTRHASTHAAGIVITPSPLLNHVPLFKTNKGEITTQYDMKSIEFVGLLKIDLLGLRTLTVIEKVLAMIHANHGVRIRPEEIPNDDPDTFELLRQGRTVGVFQLESAGMRELLKNLRPESFHDIVAVNALHRPGPLGSDMVDYFVECKHGRKKIKYEIPLLEPILRQTYGVILYQEQVMRIASSMAGFSLGEADLLRKAMGKKDKSVMAAQRAKFLEGASRNGVGRAKAQRIFDQMEKFAGYGFNKSHSTAYAVISVRTAYLKAHYPVEFMAANLTTELDNTDRILVLLEACREMGIEVVPPDVNLCGVEFEARDGKIIYGLAAIKHVGSAAIRHLVREREKGGPYKSLTDLCERVDLKSVNKRVLESLIQSGALDCLPGHRAQKLHNLAWVMDTAQRRSEERSRGQFSFAFGSDVSSRERLEDCEPWSVQERLRREKEALGFFLSGHPLDRFKNLIRMMSEMSVASIKSSPNGRHAVVGGLVSAIKTTFDRKQNPMAFITIEDGEGQAEAVIFAETFEKYREHLAQDRVLLLQGKVSSRNGGEGKLLVESVEPIDRESVPEPSEVHISLDAVRVGERKVEELKALFSGKSGKAELFFHVKNGGGSSCKIKSRSFQVGVDREILENLAGMVGAENVKLRRRTSK